MDFKRATLEGKMVDVVSVDELRKNRDIYETGNVGIEIQKHTGEEYVLPYRPDNVTCNRPGVYNIKDTNNDVVGNIIVYPDDDVAEDYKPEVVDLTSASSMEEYIEKQGRLKSLENEILTTPDNIIHPHIGPEDTALMRALKTAIIEKHIDIDKYQDGYGDNFPNDKRKLKDSDISIRLAERHFRVLGIKAEIVLSDASPDTPNPIGKEIKIPITYGDNEETDINE